MDISDILDMEYDTCCVTGHRDIPEDRLDYVKTEMKKEILQAIRDGYTRFISGFAGGSDLIFAQIVLALQKEGQSISLEAAIPYQKRLYSKDPQFQILISGCDRVKVLSPQYHRGCYFERNRYMVDESSRILAVYDGRKTGGTFYTIHYAGKHNKGIHMIYV